MLRDLQGLHTPVKLQLEWSPASQVIICYLFPWCYPFVFNKRILVDFVKDIEHKIDTIVSLFWISWIPGGFYLEETVAMSSKLNDHFRNVTWYWYDHWFWWLP